MGPRALALLVLVGLLGGCQGGSAPSKGRERCAAQVASETNGLLRPLRYGKCLLSIDAVLERERAEAQIRQQAAARKQLAKCYANQAEVKNLAMALQAAKLHLARLQAEPYVESEGPRRLDPDLQRGFASYDQELDQERYDQALAQWQQAESQRFQSWQAAQQRSIAADQARLFEPLYRADASRSRRMGGSGLGRAICRAIASSHGGRIEAGASPLGGLRVVVTLPLQPEGSA